MTVATNKHSKPLKHKKLIIIVSIILAFVLILVSGYIITIQIGKSNLRKKSDSNKAKIPVNESVDMPSDADAFYNGSAYNYNDKLINVLLLGVDKENINTTKNKSHQADAIFLASLDPDRNIANVIGISRNSIAKIDIYDINGNLFGTDKRQICLSYAFGSDDKMSSELTVKSVSNLLYNIPISGYYTIFMDSVKSIVDDVGGVPVNIDEDMTSISPNMKMGENVMINGNNALKYLRYRKELSEPRFNRQKLFINSFVGQAKKACLHNLSLPLKMYNKLAKNTVTNISSSSAVYLASEAIEAKFNFFNIEGKVGFDGTYETFEIDDDKLLQLTLDVFYNKQ